MYQFAGAEQISPWLYPSCSLITQGILLQKRDLSFMTDLTGSKKKVRNITIPSVC